MRNRGSDHYDLKVLSPNQSEGRFGKLSLVSVKDIDMNHLRDESIISSGGGQAYSAYMPIESLGAARAIKLSQNYFTSSSVLP